jgi:hypothetical protein
VNAAPKAGEAPDLNAGTEILRELLAIERERLVVAREIERKRQVVFPETSVIVRDIERLLKEIESRTSDARVASDPKSGTADTDDDQLAAFLECIPDG